MTIQSSGPIAIEDLVQEFGGGTPDNLSDYYAGQGLVPSNTNGLSGPIPTSGKLSLSDFYGAPVSLNVDFTYTCAQTSENVNVFDYPAYARGWTRVWQDGNSSYGSYSGDRLSSEGWGVAGVSFFQETDIASNFEAGITFNFDDSDYASSDFRITLQNGAKSYLLFTSGATSDDLIFLNYSSGVKKVRSVYFYLGSQPEGDHLHWKNGEVFSCLVERLN